MRKKIPKRVEARVVKLFTTGNSTVVVIPSRFLRYLKDHFPDFDQMEILFIREGPRGPYLVVRPYLAEIEV